MECAAKGGWVSAGTTQYPYWSEARSTHLNLVIDEHRINLVASLPQRAQPLLASLHDASFALDWLDDNTARLFVDELIDAIDAIVGRLDKARDERGEWCLVLGLPGGAQGAEGPSVKAVAERDNLDLVA